MSGTAEEQIDSLALARMEETGETFGQARAAVIRANPELRQRWVSEFNADQRGGVRG